MAKNVIQCPVDESWKTIFGVICPQNLTSKVSQTGTSLRAGYRSRDALQQDTVYSTCSPRAREFLRSVSFSVGRTVAEQRGVKVAKFADFGLFSPYKTPKKYIPGYNLQHRAYMQNDYNFFHVVVEGSKRCLPAAKFSCDIW